MIAVKGKLCEIPPSGALGIKNSYNLISFLLHNTLKAPANLDCKLLSGKIYYITVFP